MKKGTIDIDGKKYAPFRAEFGKCCDVCELTQDNCGSVCDRFEEAEGDYVAMKRVPKVVAKDNTEMAKTDKEKISDLPHGVECRLPSDASDFGKFPAPKTPVGLQGWICPKCGRVFSPFTSICPYCGREDRFNVTC